MLSKSIELSDYRELREKGGLAPYVEAWARCRGAGFDVYEPHEHRAWEYASALAAASEHFQEIGKLTCHNVGAGYTAFGVALSNLGFNVVESDPSARVIEALQPLTVYSGHVAYEWDLTGELGAGPPYDLVTCISTIEHIPHDDQDRAWSNLVALTAPRGLLVVTTDVAPEWTDQKEREVGYTMHDIAKRVEWLRERGFKVEADLTYHGSYVYDYSFYRIIAAR